MTPAGPLWAALEAAEARDRAAVKELVDWAGPKLSLIRETFPTYTRHDELHARNVIAIMEKLLGDHVGKLTDLEAALLILSAYFHDIGMVYTKDELADVATEEDFTEFLAARPELYVRVHDNHGIPPIDVVEDYCRSRHAARVREHLNQLPPELLRWGGLTIRDALAALCLSHNEPVRYVTDNFDRLLLGEADVRMCAILLRLADILDFDRTRSPDSIYQHLRLAERSTRRIATSDDEWRKHSAVQQIRFPADVTIDGYLVECLANPTHPEAEHGIRKFLDVITHEIDECRRTRRHCLKPQWQELPLPGALDPHIHSEGYKYGDFRFELDREAVLELFAGEDLYQDTTVFVRELLQNALDATRLRLHLFGEDRGNPPAVAVTHWEDDEGFTWVRFDDSGVGMDEGHIRRYFLRVGRSYYRSDELRANLLRHAVRTGSRAGEFGAISRFGIGILSCFLAGDKVEVSTRRRLTDGTLAAPIRLSLARHAEYFVLQDDTMNPAVMPGATARDRGALRKRCGTSIAVRIDPRICDATGAEMGARLAGLVCAPSVPVTLNGRPLGDDAERLIARAWLTEPLVAPVHTERMPPREFIRPRNLSGAEFCVPFLGPAELVLLPFDLTRHALSPDLRGQAVVLAATVDDLDARQDPFIGWPDGRALNAVREALAGRFTFREGTADVVDDVVHVRLRFDVARDAALTATTMLNYKEARYGIVPPLRGSADATMRDAALFVADSADHLGLYLQRSAASGVFVTGFCVPLNQSPNIRQVLAAVGSPAPRFGYEGVAVPETPPRSSQPPKSSHPSLDGPSLWPQTTSPFYGEHAISGAISLTGELLPQLNVARDRVRALPFSIHLHTQAAVWRATNAYADTRFADIAQSIQTTELFDVFPVGPLRMDKFRVEDPVWEFWRSVLLPDLTSTLEPAHVPWLRRGLQEFRLPAQWPQEFAHPYDHLFRHVVAATITQLFIPVVSAFGMFLTISPDGMRDALPDGLMRFPPLWFVTYQDPPTAFQSHPDSPVNLRHPVGAWIGQNAGRLEDELPHFFRRLVKLLDPKPRLSHVERTGRLNELFDTISRMRPDLDFPDVRLATSDEPEGSAIYTA